MKPSAASQRQPTPPLRTRAALASLAGLAALTVLAPWAPRAVAAGPANERGAALFVEKCAMCHRTMGMGTVLLARRMDPAVAPLEQRRDLTVEFVTTAARLGLGNMPRLSRGEVSDADLGVIAAWLSIPATP